MYIEYFGVALGEVGNYPITRTFGREADVIQ